MQVAQTDSPALNDFEGRWFDDCIVASFDDDTNAVKIEHHCDGYVRYLTNWQADQNTCPYADLEFDVCKKEFLKASDIPAGYKAMSQQDVQDNWYECASKMGRWDIISLLDGGVKGSGYGSEFFDHGEVQCDSGRWTFMMTDNDCTNDLVCLIAPVCPYANDTEVCKTWFGKGSEVPDGYKVMSQQDVQDNWNNCSPELRPYDFIYLSDGHVKGSLFDDTFSDDYPVTCDSYKHMFLMADRQCEGSGLGCE